MCNRSDDIPTDLCLPSTRSPHPPSHVSELLSEVDAFLLKSIMEQLRLYPNLIPKVAASLPSLLLEIGR